MIFNGTTGSDSNGWLFKHIYTAENLFRNIDFSNINKQVNIIFENLIKSLELSFYGSVFNNKPFTIKIKNGNNQTISAAQILYTAQSSNDIIIDCGDRKVSSLSNAFYQTRARKITFIGDTSACTNFDRFVYYIKAEVIDGTPFDFSSANGMINPFQGTSELKEIRFKPNTLHVSISFASGVISKESIKSICNALQDGVTGKILTMSTAAVKAICNSTIGTVSQVTESGVTYNFFTEDESGDTTLSEFITDTKGWTLA